MLPNEPSLLYHASTFREHAVVLPPPFAGFRRRLAAEEVRLVLQICNLNVGISMDFLRTSVWSGMLRTLGLQAVVAILHDSQGGVVLELPRPHRD